MRGKTTTIAEKEQVDLAVAAASEAFKDWKYVNARERSRLMHKLADLVERDRQELALIETIDNGKPLKNALMDVGSVVQQL